MSNLNCIDDVIFGFVFFFKIDEKLSNFILINILFCLNMLLMLLFISYMLIRICVVIVFVNVFWKI